MTVYRMILSIQLTGIKHIYPSEEWQFTQNEGIFGLLDEYHAYYYSVEAEYNLIVDYASGGSQFLNLKDGSYKPFYDSYLSFYEFSVYILSYLRKAEEDYPEIYTELINNHELMKAIIRIHDQFKEKTEEYMDFVSTIPGLWPGVSDYFREHNRSVPLRIREH